jgi:Xaa-Pro dipeptidase
MEPTEQTAVTPSQANIAFRRLDLEGKQQLIAKLLDDSKSEGLLVLHPANFRWLTSGAHPVGLIGRDELPALYYNSNQRWLLCSSLDSQRFFDEDLDALGFQQKEWHWTTGREQFLVDLIHGRRVICDQPYRDCHLGGVFLASERRTHSAYEVDRQYDLGRMVAHAVEATARNCNAGDTEEEIAGHLSHRLCRHGVEPVALQIGGDDRARLYRRHGWTSKRVERFCFIQATGRKFGLHSTVGRTVWFQKPDDDFRHEFDAAMKLGATHLLSAKIGDRVANSIEAGKAMLRTTPYEHDWRPSPPVCLTGREPSEGVFLPTAKDTWVVGWAAVWQDRVGAASLCDTYLLTDAGWKLATPFSDWPIRRAIVRGEPVDRADYLVRED